MNSYANNDNLLFVPGAPGFVTFSKIRFTAATDASNIGFANPGAKANGCGVALWQDMLKDLGVVLAFHPLR